MYFISQYLLNKTKIYTIPGTNTMDTVMQTKTDVFLLIQVYHSYPIWKFILSKIMTSWGTWKRIKRENVKTN